MSEQSTAGAEQWLPLSQAAAQLNVHPTTLRRWADNGEIPVMMTPGGHRRFATSDLAEFAEARHGLRHVDGLAQIWADEALTQARQEIVVHGNEQWLAQFDDQARARHRSLGQRLMGLTLRYLSEKGDEELLQQARQIGKEYAQVALEEQMPLAVAIRAAMFFRDTLVETALHLPENTHIRPEASLRLLRRINVLLNAVHLAIAEEYDANYANSLPRS